MVEELLTDTKVAPSRIASDSRRENKNRAAQWAIKRVIEWSLALVMLMITLPLQLLIALAVKLNSAGPVIFAQQRLGRGGRIFRMYKFRTLRWAPHSKPILNPDGSTRVEADDARITEVGRWLRTGLDELPQLWNVIKGEMALIGPRPDEPFHRMFYTQTEEQKLSVLPGITGLPQAFGRNEIPWKKRVALDLQYIGRYSLWLDLAIAVHTFRALIRKRGVYAENTERTEV